MGKMSFSREDAKNAKKERGVVRVPHAARRPVGLSRRSRAAAGRRRRDRAYSGASADHGGCSTYPFTAQRALVFWAACGCTGLTLAELGKRADGMDLKCYDVPHVFVWRPMAKITIKGRFICLTGEIF